ncbi:MAG: hypothetical protein V4692_06135, partial [Bdellovibrionota bacterium]
GAVGALDGVRFRGRGGDCLLHPDVAPPGSSSAAGVLTLRKPPHRDVVEISSVIELQVFDQPPFFDESESH